jgi:hypothetical protein
MVFRDKDCVLVVLEARVVANAMFGYNIWRFNILLRLKIEMHNVDITRNLSGHASFGFQDNDVAKRTRRSFLDEEGDLVSE